MERRNIGVHPISGTRSGFILYPFVLILFKGEIRLCAFFVFTADYSSLFGRAALSGFDSPIRWTIPK
jgi:hypothetical protein